jgi:glycosyltransferase involved in cell wall biosynthesis
MPVLDEALHLAEAVDRALAQDYSGELELVIALGPSSDGTDAVAARLAAADGRIRTVGNPSGRTASGLNAALALARHDVVIRVDGHCLLPPEYVRTAVETLAATGADNVGGVMAAVGQTRFEQTVAHAMTSWLGVGGAAFHLGGEEGPAPTVYLGAFRRSALERVGGYDESFVRAQDWEMNHRIRETGGLVWFTPRMRVEYRPRPTLGRLARQYFGYGRWRRQIMRRHPETVSARYLAPPATVVAVVVGTAAGVVGSVGGPRWLRAGLLAPAGYAALVIAGAVTAGGGLPLRSRLELPLVFATMHSAWGVGFLTSPREPATT